MTSKLCYSPALARKVGVTAALVFEFLIGWIVSNARKQKEVAYRDGQYWTFATLDYYFSNFRAACSLRSFQRAIKKLIEHGYIKREYTQRRTVLWFALVSIPDIPKNELPFGGKNIEALLPSKSSTDIHKDNQVNDLRNDKVTSSDDTVISVTDTATNTDDTNFTDNKMPAKPVTMGAEATSPTDIIKSFLPFNNKNIIKEGEMISSNFSLPSLTHVSEKSDVSEQPQTDADTNDTANTEQSKGEVCDRIMDLHSGEKKNAEEASQEVHDHNPEKKEENEVHDKILASVERIRANFISKNNADTGNTQTPDSAPDVAAHGTPSANIEPAATTDTADNSRMATTQEIISLLLLYKNVFCNGHKVDDIRIIMTAMQLYGLTCQQLMLALQYLGRNQPFFPTIPEILAAIKKFDADSRFPSADEAWAEVSRNSRVYNLSHPWLWSNDVVRDAFYSVSNAHSFCMMPESQFSAVRSQFIVAYNGLVQRHRAKAEIDLIRNNADFNGLAALISKATK